MRETTDPAKSNFLAATLSTIASRRFSEVIVLYQGLEFHGLKFYLHHVLNPY